MSLSAVYRHFDGEAEVTRYLAAAKRTPHGPTNQDADPEQLRELLPPVRANGRAPTPAKPDENSSGKLPMVTEA